MSTLSGPVLWARKKPVELVLVDFFGRDGNIPHAPSFGRERMDANVAPVGGDALLTEKIRNVLRLMAAVSRSFNPQRMVFHFNNRWEPVRQPIARALQSKLVELAREGISCIGELRDAPLDGFLILTHGYLRIWGT